MGSNRFNKAFGRVVSKIPRNVRKKTGINALIKSKPAAKGRRVVSSKVNELVYGKKRRRKR